MNRAEELKLARLRKQQEAKKAKQQVEQSKLDDLATLQETMIKQVEALKEISLKEPIDPAPQLEELNSNIIKLIEKMSLGFPVTNILDAKATVPERMVIANQIEIPEWLAKDESLKDIAGAIKQNSEVLGSLEKAAGQKPEDFVPFRRVRMEGKRLVFDDRDWQSTSGGGGGGISGPITLTETNYAVRYEKVDANLAYLGEAAIGSATSSPVWRLSKVATVGGAVITWADGDDNFDNVWDDRATASYS